MHNSNRNKYGIFIAAAAAVVIRELPSSRNRQNKIQLNIWFY